MREVAIIGIGQTQVVELWDKSLREIAGEAVIAALNDAGRENADGMAQNIGGVGPISLRTSCEVLEPAL